MTPIFAAKLGLRPRSINVGVQKIDSSPLETYGMTLVIFSVWVSLGKIQFFEETFLLANPSIEVVLGMSFLSLNNTNIQFTKLEKLT